MSAAQTRVANRRQRVLETLVKLGDHPYAGAGDGTFLSFHVRYFFGEGTPEAIRSVSLPTIAGDLRHLYERGFLDRHVSPGDKMSRYSINDKGRAEIEKEQR